VTLARSVMLQLEGERAVRQSVQDKQPSHKSCVCLSHTTAVVTTL
jgi:hypothetical protein